MVQPTYQRGLEPHIQQQITAAVVGASASNGKERRGAEPTKPIRTPSPLKSSIEYLLTDEELKRRCADLLKARKNFDRVYREATVVLDARLKRLGKITGKMNPGVLVAKVLHPDNGSLILSDYPDERQGFFDLFRGIMAAFRNPVHHSLNDKLTREDALRFCGFIDTLLSILDQAKVRE